MAQRILIAVFIAGLAATAAAQNVATDSISHERILIGSVDRSSFSDSAWYKSNYDLYVPSAKLIAGIDSLGAGDSVAVVFGSWCSDSHMWVPMFLRIVDSTILVKHLSFIAVPRSNGWRDRLTPGLGIEKVPTFIFYGNGEEIGRIVEEPKGDIGENIIQILGSRKQR